MSMKQLVMTPQWILPFVKIYIIIGLSRVSSEWIKIPSTCGGASSNFDGSGWHCSKALDGRMMLYQNSEWSLSCNSATTAWIRINFDQSYAVQYIRMMQRAYVNEQFKDFTLTFEDGTTQSGVLSRRDGIDKYDISARWWDEYVVNGVVSSFVRIDITSVYATSCNGFVEVEVYTGQSSNPCPAQYTYLEDRCYVIDQSQTWSRDDAHAQCDSRGGHLVDLETQAEVNKVEDWINNAWGSDLSFWTGGAKVDGQWKWSNGDTVQTLPSVDSVTHEYVILSEPASFNLRSSGDAALYALCETSAVSGAPEDSEDCEAEGDGGEYFKVQGGKQLQNHAIISLNAVSLTHCVTHCKMIDTCQSVNFNHVTQKCDVNTNTASESPGDITGSVGASYADHSNRCN